MSRERELLVDDARVLLLPTLLALEARVRAAAPADISPGEVRSVAVAVARVVLDELDGDEAAMMVRVMQSGGEVVRVLSVVPPVDELEASRAGHPSGRVEVSTSGRDDVVTS